MGKEPVRLHPAHEGAGESGYNQRLEPGIKDVVIVGGGLAGLAAGWRLRHWDTVLLESGNRVGGRIRSERRGRY